MRKCQQSAFALFEILLATLVLAGLIYVSLSYFSGQQKQQRVDTTARHFAIVINNLIRYVAINTNHKCPSGDTSNNLAACMQLSKDSNYVTLLRNEGLDLTQITVNIDNPPQ